MEFLPYINVRWVKLQETHHYMQMIGLHIAADPGRARGSALGKRGFNNNNHNNNNLVVAVAKQGLEGVS